MKSINELMEKQPANLKESVESLKSYIIETSKKAHEENKPIEDVLDEGIISGIIGGVVGGTVGKNIMQAVCQALGVNENSALGSLLTSRAILTMVGAKLGYKW